MDSVSPLSASYVMVPFLEPATVTKTSFISQRLIPPAYKALGDSFKEIGIHLDCRPSSLFYEKKNVGERSCASLYPAYNIIRAPIIVNQEPGIFVVMIRVEDQATARRDRFCILIKQVDVGAEGEVSEEVRSKPQFYIQLPGSDPSEGDQIFLVNEEGLSKFLEEISDVEMGAKSILLLSGEEKDIGYQFIIPSTNY